MRTVRISAAVLGIFVLGNIVWMWERPWRKDCALGLRTVTDSLVALVHLEGCSIYDENVYVSGFQYTLLSAMADTLGFNMMFDVEDNSVDRWRMLLSGEVDVLAMDVEDTVPSLYARDFVSSMPFDDFVWTVRSEDECLFSKINQWLGFMTKGSDYAEMRQRFFRSYNLAPYLDSGRKTDRISPYDGIVRRYTRLLGWDWRLLSAVIYKESRFMMEACSHRGAVGLMQVRRATAGIFGITDLFNPDENVRAGVLYLRQLEERYEEMGLDSVNVVKFTLASYNAGASRIDDCIRFTYAQGRDGSDWETVAATIPMMAEPEYYEDAEYLRHGKFHGRETIRYVRDVLSKYEEYLSVVE